MDRNINNTNITIMPAWCGDFYKTEYYWKLTKNYLKLILIPSFQSDFRGNKNLTFNENGM